MVVEGGGGVVAEAEVEEEGGPEAVEAVMMRIIFWSTRKMELQPLMRLELITAIVGKK